MIKPKTLRISFLIISSLIFGFILLLNFGLGSLIENAEAQNNVPSNTATKIDSTDKTQVNLNATDTFDPDAIPYFQTATTTAAGNTTVTIYNHWTQTIFAIINSVTTEIAPSTSSVLTSSGIGLDLTISALDKNGFRGWHSATSPFIRAYGANKNAFETLNYIPDMRYFTTDSSGTRAGDYFFSFFNAAGSLTSLPAGSFDLSSITTAGNYFFYRFNHSGSLTSLPEGSFDLSSITSAGNHFFDSFNYSGSLTSLPEGSFDTSNIKTSSSDFFGYFNNNGHLTVLPRFSFNFDSMESTGTAAFQGFNYNGTLSSLPYNSFNFDNIDVNPSDAYSFSGFNYLGLITKEDSGVAIKNFCNTAFQFWWALGSSPNNGNIAIPSGSSFSYYAMDAPVTFTLYFFDDDRTLFDFEETALQGTKFTKPANPTKSGYKFIQWVIFGTDTPFDWNASATGGYQLQAQYEPEPSPTPTTSPTSSPTTSPTPTKSPTSSTSPSPSPSNSLPSTGDESLIIFSLTGTFLLLAIISFAIYYMKKKSKSS